MALWTRLKACLCEGLLLFPPLVPQQLPHSAGQPAFHQQMLQLLSDAPLPVLTSFQPSILKLCLGPPSSSSSALVNYELSTSAGWLLLQPPSALPLGAERMNVPHGVDKHSLWKGETKHRPGTAVSQQYQLTLGSLWRERLFSLGVPGPPQTTFLGLDRRLCW